MKCPHCETNIHEAFVGFPGFGGAEGAFFIGHMACPACNKTIVRIALDQHADGRTDRDEFIVYPKSLPKRTVPAEVPEPYRQDFIEACEVLTISPKASAALTRRTLQALLRGEAKTAKKDLADQIAEVIASGKLPSHLEEGLHAVRNIGNFAAHEIKSKVTGSIVEVETGEADWNLDILESLFDFYFVQPTLAAKRKAELNKKLAEAGKPLMP